MPSSFVFSSSLGAALFLCCLVGGAIGQPCLYNYTIGASALPVVITQSAPVCLICSNTGYRMWNVGSASFSGIPDAPYILYVTSPAALFTESPTVYCFTNAINLVSSTVQVAISGLNTTNVTEGGTLNLDCKNVVTVSVAAITFLGQSWFDPQNNPLLPSGPTYSLQSVNRTASGNYKCVTRLVSNVNGVTSSIGIAVVIINYPPKIVCLQSTVYAVQGSNVQFYCTIQDGPPLNITWVSPAGNVIVTQSHFLVQSNMNSTYLTISSLVGEADNGTYTCTVSNSIGLSSTSTVQLFVQVPPNSPTNLVATYSNSTVISLSWTNSFDGYSSLTSVIISYAADGYSQEGTTNQTFPSGTTATLRGLHPNSSYIIHVRLVNAVGLTSSPANITQATVDYNPVTAAPITTATLQATPTLASPPLDSMSSTLFHTSMWMCFISAVCALY